jgi:hypothetical protein
MESTTRISDLPDNITMQPQNTFTQNMGGPMEPIMTQRGNYDNGPSTNYIPLNIHANPYGISAQNPIMPIPQQPNVQQIQQVAQLEQLSKQQQYELQNMPQVRLPSRDIPVDTIQYLNDEEVQPNYIPKTKLTKDYIREHEDIAEKKLIDHERKKHRENKLDELMSEFQIPLFIAFLYFFFQLPIINTMIFKKFSFLSIYNDDGNFNFNGLVLKSMVFGFFYYLIQKITTFIVEF